ncbi:MAG: SUMF1/EgtB/PvdO family nonheme iron enzyme [Bacteroidales bacterium]|nr:SUMF1/EgtB/PvdO family nonheme iron enzyme [Bacteroidales bacterium]
MRKLLVILAIFIIALASGCGYSGNGELTGVERKTWYTPDPYGMFFIPPGSYQMGPSDEDVPYAMTAQSKTVTIQGFWMDETEITNSEYRQFVYWVRDSLALTTLGKETKNSVDFGDISTKRSYQPTDFIIDDAEVSEEDVNFMTNMYENGEFDFDDYDNNNFLDWNGPLDYNDLELKGILIKNEIPSNFNQTLFLLPPAELYRFNRKIDLNTDALYYEYFWMDLKQAAQKHVFKPGDDGVIQDAELARNFEREADHGLRIGRHFNPETGQYEGTIKDREKLKEDAEWEDFADREIKNYEGKSDAGRHGGRYSYYMHEKVHIYPDTLCWISDFTYSYNEPMAKAYFWHPAYDYYPVVGVTWKQASAFCVWRTMLKNASQAAANEYALQDYRLPTESEWEYAARGGLDLMMYPWGGLYTRNYSGCHVANFKPMRGNYVDDGGVQTLMVATFDPNEFGLYDMGGNVAEWTSNAFDEASYNYTHDLNPDYQYYAHPDDMPALKRKVIRGGSWKDVSYYMQNGSRTYEYQDSAKCYIGFRCVREYLGRHRGDGTSYSQVY